MAPQPSVPDRLDQYPLPLQPERYTFEQFEPKAPNGEYHPTHYSPADQEAQIAAELGRAHNAIDAHVVAEQETLRDPELSLMLAIGADIELQRDRLTRPRIAEAAVAPYLRQDHMDLAA